MLAFRKRATCRPRLLLALTIVLLLTMGAACSLFVGLDGLQSGDAGEVDATSGDANVVDTTTDDAVSNVDAATTDATLDATDDGPITSEIAFVQINAVLAQGDAGGAALDVAAVKPGDTILVAVVYDGSQTATISDNVGDSFVTEVGPYGSAHEDTNYIFAAIGSAGNATHVTLTIAGAPQNHSFIELFVAEYSGIAAFDKSATGIIDGPGTISTSLIATKSEGELMFVWTDDGAVTPGPGFTTRSTFDDDLIEDRLVGSPQSVKGVAHTSGEGEMLLATFTSQ